MSNSPDGFSEQRRERPLAPPPRSTRRIDDDDDRPRRRPSGDGGGGALKVIFIVLGVVLLVSLVCGGGLVGLTVYSVGKVRNAASRAYAQNNMKQLALAMHNYHDTHGHMPASLPTKDGKPGLSWRVALLPFLDQGPLYNQFKLDEPWDSPNNIKLLDQMPRLFVNQRMAHPMNHTCYRVFVGGGAMFEHGKKTRMGSFGKPRPDEIYINDGLSNTIMFIEAADTVPWTKPDELTYSPTGPLPALGVVGETTFTIAFADGSVRSLNRDTAQNMIRAAITANGNENVILP